MSVEFSSINKKKHSVMASLPKDLFHRILLRLPCKDIVVCKCVCREWYNLICNPVFSREYANNPPFTSIFLFQHHQRTEYALLLEIVPDGRVIKTTLRPTIPNFYLRLPTTTETQESCIIGSCNGLLFFSQWRWPNARLPYHTIEKVYCSNPLSGDCVLLAQQECSSKSHDLWPVQYRIGYISSTGNIKLLRLVKDIQQQSVILTVGTDRSWRRLSVHLDYHFGHKGVSFNGAYHWIHKDTYDMWLKTFDFEKEEIGPKWKLPHNLGQGRKWRRNLEVVNNHLSVIEMSLQYEMVIWTMEEYGVAESWSRKMMIRNQDGFLYLQATLANGDILFSDRFGAEVKLFNPEKEDTKIFIINPKTYEGKLYAAEFAPKFCSLDQSWNIQNV